MSGLDVTSGIGTISGYVSVNALPVGLWGGSGNLISDYSGALNVNISGGTINVSANVSGQVVRIASSGGIPISDYSGALNVNISGGVVSANVSGNVVQISTSSGLASLSANVSGNVVQISTSSGLGANVISGGTIPVLVSGAGVSGTLGIAVYQSGGAKFVAVESLTPNRGYVATQPLGSQTVFLQQQAATNKLTVTGSGDVHLIVGSGGANLITDYSGALNVNISGGTISSNVSGNVVVIASGFGAISGTAVEISGQSVQIAGSGLTQFTMLSGNIGGASGITNSGQAISGAWIQPIVPTVYDYSGQAYYPMAAGSSGSRRIVVNIGAGNTGTVGTNGPGDLQNGTNSLAVVGFNLAFNGANFDRIRTVDAVSGSTQSGLGILASEIIAFDSSGATHRQINTVASGSNALLVGGGITVSGNVHIISASGNLITDFSGALNVNISGGSISVSPFGYQSGTLIGISGGSIGLSGTAVTLSGIFSLSNISGGVSVSGIVGVSGNVAILSGAISVVSGSITINSGNVTILGSGQTPFTMLSGNIFSSGLQSSGQTISGAWILPIAPVIYDYSGKAFYPFASVNSGLMILSVGGNFSGGFTVSGLVGISGGGITVSGFVGALSGGTLPVSIVSGSVAALSGLLVEISGQAVTVSVSGDVVSVSGAVSVSGNVLTITGGTGVNLVSGAYVYGYRWKFISGANLTNVQSGASVLHTLTVNQWTSGGQIAIWDSLSGVAGSLFANIDFTEVGSLSTNAFAPQTLTYDAYLQSGLVVITSGAAMNITVTFRNPV